MAANSLDRAKQAVRTQVWDALTAADAVHDPSVHGRIPHFKCGSLRSPRTARPPAGPALQSPPRSSPAGARAALYSYQPPAAREEVRRG
ncbi:hypothetical protein [Streptomyces viridosporus]|uniref:hypothetical protein n=1 Tax=Streptomyces viridosporus TaxID=67581 RepID=UPI00370087B5